jgi:hypothetical protein
MTASATALDRDLQAFAVELFEHAGGIAEWPSPEAPGSVVVPPELARAADLPGEEFALTTQPAPRSLLVSLAGDFLDVAARLLDAAVPREGSLCIPERYLTRRDLTDKVTRTFHWQNARARVSAAEPSMVEYHLWTLLGSLRSEDVWEGTFRAALNAESGAVVPLTEVFQEPDLRGESPSPSAAEPATYPAAMAEAKRQLITASAEFVRRIEQRLERDRKRLQDYYRALAREAGGSKRRAATLPSPEEVAARKKAVDLELRRKLAELHENYALRAELRPIALARVRLPVLVVPVAIQRKQATRPYRLYWNSLARELEPLTCNRCHRPTFSPSFTNETVDLLCSSCAKS